MILYIRRRGSARGAIQMHRCTSCRLFAGVAISKSDVSFAHMVFDFVRQVSNPLLSQQLLSSSSAGGVLKATR
jgi:hypothetical protein